MKIASYWTKGTGTSWGVLLGDRLLDVPRYANARREPFPQDVRTLLVEHRLEWLRDVVRRIEVSDRPDVVIPSIEARFLPPLPNTGKIIGIGRNYLDHISEAELRLPRWPKLFPKFPSTVIGPNDRVVRPTLTSQLDFEVEVGVVIGKPTRNVREERAMEHVAGYTVLNDISARDLQFADEQITLGKNFDTFCPMGPVIATTDELPDPSAIGLSLRLNGELMQESSTKNLIFSIPYLVAFISYVMTLLPGDIISTGTPSGVGCFRSPPVWLREGDMIESSVEGVGTLVNFVEEATEPSPLNRTGAA